MDQSALVTTLNQIVSDYGTDILNDGKRVIAMFSDYCPDGRAEKNKLRIAYEFDVVGLLMRVPNKTIDVSIACTKAIDLLKEQAFIDENVAASIVCDIADALKLQYDLNMQFEINAKQTGKVPRRNTSPKNIATQCHPFPKDMSGARAKITEKQASAIPVWVPGSGIGYSTHNNLILPFQAYDDLESQQNLDLTLTYNITHPLKSLLTVLRLHNKYRIACAWKKAQMYCNVYDAYVLDGGGHSPSAVKYKKYNEKYMKKLERKFWS